MTTTLEARLASFSSPVLSAFRIIFGLLFALNGSMKTFGWPLGTSIPVGTWPGWFAGVIELVTGLLIVVGLFTRIAAFVASGEMAFAYFFAHWPPLGGGPAGSFWPLDPQTGGNGGELAILYCFAFLLLATMGAGTLSVDARRRSAGVGSSTGRFGRRDGVGTDTATQRRRVDRTEPAPRRSLLDRFRR